MSKEFDFLIFIGRFSPFHKEHKHIIDVALEKSKNVIVLVGSSGSSRTTRNPFSFSERKDMICNSFLNKKENLFVVPIYDKTYNDSAWVSQVQQVVKEQIFKVVNPNKNFSSIGFNDLKIGLIGASKDHTSYYLNLFPQWKSVNVDIKENTSSTSIRFLYFDGSDIPENLITDNVKKFLDDFKQTKSYHDLKGEFFHAIKYKQSWRNAPYPVKHFTVDAVVEQSGHILLVKRRSMPGKGLWALPGGHLNEYEKIEDGMLRELHEETKLSVPIPVLLGSVQASRTFDDPYRSQLGRVITQAFYIKLKDSTKLPKVKGSDDAEKAKWVPISDIKEDMMFDDHYHIINCFLKI